MDFSLSEEHSFLQSTIRTFVKRECPRERIHALDEEGTFPVDLLAKLAEMGLCSLTVPEEFGGSGRDLLGTSLVMEEIATMSPALAGLYASVTLSGGAIISALGSNDQCKRWLPAIAEGGLVFSTALTDRHRDPALTITTSDAGFRLNGTVPFVGFVEYADYVIVSASMDDDENQTTCFVLPLDAQGVKRQPMDTVGWRGTGSGAVHMEDVHVSVNDVLGGEDELHKGQAQAKLVQSIQRLAVAAIGVGLAQGALDYAANYAGERDQFGQPIINFEAIQHMLVDLTIGLRTTRWLLRHACWQADQNQPFALNAAMACLQASELARQAGLQGVHILGGYGYMAEYDAERYMRDSLVVFSGSKASALLKNDIGHLAGLEGLPE